MSATATPGPRLLKRRKLVRKRASVEPESIRCTECGAPLEVQHAAMAEILSCGHCGAVLDLRDPERKVLRKILVGRRRPESTLEIGAKGGFSGQNWTVFGRIRLVDSEHYHWDEYLLFSETSGYAWLEEDEGKWSLERKSKNKPEFDPKEAKEGQRFKFLGETYRIEERGQGTIRYIEGEFPYHAERGDIVSTADAQAVGSGSRISASWTESELEWLSGKALSPETVALAFGIRVPPARKEFELKRPNQSNGCWVFFGLFFGFFCLLVVGSLVFGGRGSLSSGSSDTTYNSSSSDSSGSSYRSSSGSGSSYGSGSSSSGSSYGSSSGGWGK